MLLWNMTVRIDQVAIHLCDFRRPHEHNYTHFIHIAYMHYFMFDLIWVCRKTVMMYTYMTATDITHYLSLSVLIRINSASESHL